MVSLTIHRRIVLEPPLIRAWPQYEHECLLIRYFRQQLRPVVSLCSLWPSGPPGDHLRKPSHRTSNDHYLIIIIDTNTKFINDIIDKLPLKYHVVKQHLTNPVNNTTCHHIADH
jgi:hypothetical protein